MTQPNAIPKTEAGADQLFRFGCSMPRHIVNRIDQAARRWSTNRSAALIRIFLEWETTQEETYQLPQPTYPLPQETNHEPNNQ